MKSFEVTLQELKIPQKSEKYVQNDIKRTLNNIVAVNFVLNHDSSPLCPRSAIAKVRYAQGPLCPRSPIFKKVRYSQGPL